MPRGGGKRARGRGRRKDLAAAHGPPRRTRRSKAEADLLRELRARHRADLVVRDVARGLSLSAALAKRHTTAETVRKYAGDRIRDGVGSVSGPSRRTARLNVVTTRGMTTLAVRPGRGKQLVVAHRIAVDRYLLGAGEDVLLPFRGKGILVDGERHLFATDPRLLDAMGSVGAFQNEELYAQAS